MYNHMQFPNVPVILTVYNTVQNDLKPKLQESILPSAVSLVLNVAQWCQLGSHLQSRAPLGVLWPTGGEASEGTEE